MTSAREAVEKDYKTVEKAFHEGDADSISFMYTEDAELFIPGAPVLEGRRAIHEAWEKIVGSGGNILHTVVREVREWRFGVRYRAIYGNCAQRQCSQYGQMDRNLEATVNRRMENPPRLHALGYPACRSV